MSEIPELACYILDTGHCLAHEYVLIQGGERKQVHCHSIVALLGHPQHGWLFWDAGYAPRMLPATAHFPFSLYRLITPLRLRPELAAVAQLLHFGLVPQDVKAIVISHFHADHLCGLLDFPASRFIAAREAYAPLAGAKGVAAMKQGFIPSLLPADFGSRVTLLDAFSGPPLPRLGPTYDYYGDGSLQLVRLPGHARGQLGLLANTQLGRLFFVADSCWMARSVAENRTVSRLGGLLSYNTALQAATIAQLHAFAAACPDVMIVPSHCPETFAELVATKAIAPYQTQ